MRVSLFVILAFKVCLVVQGQKQQGTIYFKNGEVLEGLVKLKDAEKLKFGKTKKDKPATYFWKEISKITIYEAGNGKFHFFNLKIKGENKSSILQLVYEGKIDLYKEVTKGYNMMLSGSTGAMPFTVKKEYTSFYIKKTDEKEVFQIKLDNSFKGVALNLFKDCDEVVKKINDGIYTEKNPQDIVFEYNYRCN